MMEAVFEVVTGLTGHLLLWALTLGRWDISNGRDTAATVVGLLFWVVIGVGVWFAFFR
ncbi:hypothetical protein [Gemmata sp.]|uniref:hypothetical protein n=1 Tax=Gemmata sp. TaxID=1914242 RepID=UPI003F704E82